MLSKCIEDENCVVSIVDSSFLYHLWSALYCLANIKMLHLGSAAFVPASLASSGLALIDGDRFIYPRPWRRSLVKPKEDAVIRAYKKAWWSGRPEPC